MDKWKKKLSGAVIASVLALTLSSKAYADPADESVPDLPVPQYEEKAADTGSPNTPAKVSLSSDKTETPKTDTNTHESKGPAEVKSASQEAASSNTESTVSDTGSKGSPASSASSEPASETPDTERGSVDTSKGAAASENGSARADNSVPVTVANTVTDNENGTNASHDTVQNDAGDLTLTTGGTISGADNEGGDNAVFTRAASFNLNSSAGTDPKNLSGDDETEPTEQTRSEGESDPAVNTGSEEPGTITLGSTTFTPGHDESTDLSSSTTAENDRFGFDAGATAAASDDSFYMVDYDGSSQTLSSTNCDINIKAAGLNRLGSIQADGDVNITGTGILLLDSLSISENHNFFLHPIEGIYDSGSVAVFLRQQISDDPESGPGGNSSGTGAPEESGSEGNTPSASAPKSVYMLINGPAVPGILDEKYTLPENVSLIVPDNSSLILQSTVQETVLAHEEDGEEVPESVTVYTTTPDYIHDSNYSYKYSAPNLTIPTSSGLTLESGASLTSNSIIAQFGHIYRPLINVNGSLNGAGIIKNTYVLFNSTSAGSTSAFQNSRIINHSQNISLTIYDSCSLLSADGTSIGTIDLMPGSVLNCYADPASSGCSVTLNDGISGSGSIMFKAGDYYICNENFACPSSVTISTDGSHVTINDVSGTLAALEIKGASIAVDPDDAVMPGPNAIPVVTVNLSTVYWSVMGYTTWGGSTVSTATLDPNLVSEDGSLSFQTLAEEYSAGFTDYQSSSKYLIQVYTINNGKLISHLIDIDEEGNYTAGSVPANQIWLIRLLYISASTTQGSGGSVMSTNTSITGSGILGGSGAGSMSGGTGTQIDLSSFNTGNNQSNGNGDSGNGSSQSNDSSGSGAGNNNTGDNSNTVIPAPTGGDPTSDNQTNDNGGNQDNNDPAADNTYITPEDIKPDVKPEDLVITVTEQETFSVSSKTNSQTVSTQQAEAVSLEEAAPVYTLTVTVDNQQVTKLNEKITVRFSCPAPKTNRQIFAVFRDDDGSLKVFKARYDKIKKQLVFDTDMLGDFAVVCTDFKGELYSEEFYRYLETLDQVKTLR